MTQPRSRWTVFTKWVDISDDTGYVLDMSQYLTNAALTFEEDTSIFISWNLTDIYDNIFKNLLYFHNFTIFSPGKGCNTFVYLWWDISDICDDFSWYLWWDISDIRPTMEVLTWTWQTEPAYWWRRWRTLWRRRRLWRVAAFHRNSHTSPSSPCRSAWGAPGSEVTQLQFWYCCKHKII